MKIIFKIFKVFKLSIFKTVTLGRTIGQNKWGDVKKRRIGFWENGLIGFVTNKGLMNFKMVKQWIDVIQTLGKRGFSDWMASFCSIKTTSVKPKWNCIFIQFFHGLHFLIPKFYIKKNWFFKTFGKFLEPLKKFGFLGNQHLVQDTTMVVESFRCGEGIRTFPNSPFGEKFSLVF
ncbi:MAG: hypothetical protein CM15mL4_3040 [uncultured marine virus]|nr:MAG: hypothetical protein CM15mL4_3040 [uncultured marine virus]